MEIDININPKNKKIEVSFPTELSSWRHIWYACLWYMRCIGITSGTRYYIWSGIRYQNYGISGM